jgi:hypothetical protein
MARRGGVGLGGFLQGRDEVVTTIEAQLRWELHKYAVELRKVAYSLPNGVGEHELLRLSEQMNSAADQLPG